jgi:hypothetical protein
MEPIHVPGPPKEAFNKSRRISDLIRAQINHLKHLEQKLPAQLRQQIPQHEITTEDDAARYIAPMTNLLRAQVAVSSAQPIRSVKRPTPLRSIRGLALAAGAEVASETPGSSRKRSIVSLSSKTAKSPKGKK